MDTSISRIYVSDGHFIGADTTTSIFNLLRSTTLHSVAAKIADQGSSQPVGIVSYVGFFLWALAVKLRAVESPKST